MFQFLKSLSEPLEPPWRVMMSKVSPHHLTHGGSSYCEMADMMDILVALFSLSSPHTHCKNLLLQYMTSSVILRLHLVQWNPHTVNILHIYMFLHTVLRLLVLSKLNLIIPDANVSIVLCTHQCPGETGSQIRNENRRYIHRLIYQINEQDLLYHSI